MYSIKSLASIVLLLNPSSSMMNNSTELTPFVGIPFSNFSAILARECNSELSQIEDPSSAQTAWESATADAWNNLPQGSASPFLVSNKTPQMSGYKRKQSLLPFFASSTMDESVVYNRGDQTVVLIQTTKEDALSLKSKLENNTVDSNFIQLQPLLPMSKIMQGIVASSKRFSDGKRSRTKVIVSSGPGVATNNEGDMQLAADILQNVVNRDEITVENDLKASFPFSWRSISANLTGTNSSSTSQNTTMSTTVDGSYMSFEIHQRGRSIDQYELLSFIAGLAAQPQITNVELEGDITMFNAI